MGYHDRASGHPLDLASSPALEMPSSTFFNFPDGWGIFSRLFSTPRSVNCNCVCRGSVYSSGRPIQTLVLPVHLFHSSFCATVECHLAQAIVRIVPSGRFWNSTSPSHIPEVSVSKWNSSPNWVMPEQGTEWEEIWASGIQLHSLKTTQRCCPVRVHSSDATDEKLGTNMS